MENLMVCPVCGRIHRRKMDDKALFLCITCGTFFVWERDEVDIISLKDDDIGLVDEDFMSSIGCQCFIAKKGIAVPMKNGKDANLFFRDQYFFLSDATSFNLYQYSMFQNKAPRQSLPFEVYLSMTQPKSSMTIDRDALSDRLGSYSMELLDRKYHDIFFRE